MLTLQGLRFRGSLWPIIIEAIYKFIIVRRAIGLQIVFSIGKKQSLKSQRSAVGRAWS